MGNLSACNRKQERDQKPEKTQPRSLAQGEIKAQDQV